MLLRVCLLCSFLFWQVEAPGASGPPQAAIASAHPLATQAGFEILRQGGNAFDAAVAVAATLGVVEPASSGLGGGGFFLLHRADDGFETMVDARERAPLGARRDMYLDKQGRLVPGLSVDGPLAAAIPGMPAALVHLTEHYGRLPLAVTLAPAIRYAQHGFPVGPRYLSRVQRRSKVLKAYPQTAKLFLDHGQLPRPGFRLVQPALSRVLQSISQLGKAGFYRGWVAERLVSEVNRAGGIWRSEDLAEYRVIERSPVRGVYKGIQITTSAPPSSGGIVLLETLNILSAYSLGRLDSVTVKHLIVEAWRRAYRDRALYLGDPDFVDMPIERLLSPAYAAGLRVAIRHDRALPSGWLNPAPEGEEANHTTHFSILDREGNRVAATLSINYLFGSGYVVPGTGILLNDEMDDFAAKPGEPNLYGLVGGDANAIAPGKRMLSSMTPTFLETPERVAILGTPGGSRIISMVTLAVLDFAAGFRPSVWVGWPRYHHQFLPDEIQYEPGALTLLELERLKQYGHRLRPLTASYGNMQAILWDKTVGRVDAASDPRGEGLSMAE